MQIDQTQEILPDSFTAGSAPTQVEPEKHSRFRRRFRVLLIWLALWFAFASNVSSTHSALFLRNRALAETVAGWEFDFLGWEAEALSSKISTAFSSSRLFGSDIPLSPDDAKAQVIAYTEQAREVGQLERALSKMANKADITPSQSQRITQLQTNLATFRQGQGERTDTERTEVEQHIERQVSEILQDEGFGLMGNPFPPVQFLFAKPPKKLIVSRRDRIETVYAQMVDAEIDIGQIAESEQKIHDEQNLSAYITNIGGLGTYPAMVVDQASFSWILSTVAHEWVHNYLNFFPLGLSYASEPRLIVMNETIAEIAGNEIGEQVQHRFYPELVPPSPAADTAPEPEGDMTTQTGPQTEPPPFDFHQEMRETRLEVDRLLEAGKIEKAEAYMDKRRLFFIENDVNIRVLNQAYFAFHGSYATSPTSVDPIGPKLYRLRESMPDIKTFLQTTRWFTSVDDLDVALAEWETK